MHRRVHASVPQLSTVRGECKQDRAHRVLRVEPAPTCCFIHAAQFVAGSGESADTTQNAHIMAYLVATFAVVAWVKVAERCECREGHPIGP
jgi:hypothetical protein